jgi:hypothetical protein
VRDFLLSNLEPDVSTIDEVTAYMHSAISKSDECYYEPQPPSNLETVDADKRFSCFLISHKTPLWHITTYYYYAVFYFTDDVLVDIKVEEGNAGL